MKPIFNTKNPLDMVFALVHGNAKAAKANALNGVKKVLTQCKIEDIDRVEDEIPTCHVALNNSRVILLTTA